MNSPRMIVSACIVLAALGACDATPSRTAPPVPGTGAGSPFGAVRIEIHPLTRLVRDGTDQGSLQIEAHVELFDRWGHGVKDVGVMRFELYRSAAPGFDAEPVQELVWTLDLSDPAESSARYDPVTRTYIAPLDEAPDWTAAGMSPTLLVQFTTPDGRRLTATRRLD
jgi:hypothetical protein